MTPPNTFMEQVNRIRELADKLARPIRLMEVCGTHTVAAFRTGLRSLLPSNVLLLSGPGCPVCVTTIDYVDHAIALAALPGTVIATFGDMIRVPGTVSTLESAKARGADIMVVYSPLDALELAKKSPDKQVIFLGVGFETTSPTVAWTIKHARINGVSNYKVLCAHKLIPPAMDALLKDRDTAIDGFMCPGHVSVIIGANAYKPLAESYKAPFVISGFEATDMAVSIEMLLRQLLEGRSDVEVQYSRSVTAEGNREAQLLLAEVFSVCDAGWRGLATIPSSGYTIAPKYAAHDAGDLLSGLSIPPSVEPAGCRCGAVLKGTCLPPECPLFGIRCTPDNPVGACMVSTEGSCAAYFKFGKRQ